ncbi:MAG TPA: hemerythrin domain-containing protein [Ktedonobacteraceae bacterium]|jgi:uncharacterized protein (DUF2249 family)/hemerythrin-like domain-containing protein
MSEVVETLDVRDMLPRERHPAVFVRLDALKAGESLRLIHDHNPASLRYQLMAERPNLFTWEPEMLRAEVWVICIQRIQAGEEQTTSEQERKPELVLPTQPLRDEHQELLPRIAMLRTVADSIGSASGAALQREVREAWRFLVQHLLPHAQAEERVLYPAVGKLLGAPEATATMSCDHTAIRQRTQDLEDLLAHLEATGPDQEQERALRLLLYGLFTLLTVHMAKEEEIYLPLLDARLTSREASRLQEEMERAARAAKGGRG